MNLSVGAIRNNYAGFESIAKLAKDSSRLIFDSVDLDFSRCQFFEANMAAALYAVVARLRDDLNRVSIKNTLPSIERILRKNRFLSEFGFPALPDSNQTTLPFKIFKMIAGEQFYDYLEIYMNGRGIPAMSPALEKRFRQSLLEIFQNAALHSESGAGVFACGQFFPQKRRLDFSIADAGIGIRGKCQKAYRQSEN